MKKPVIIYVITDGAPTAEPRDTMVKGIRTTADAMRLAKRANAFAFQFIQVTATLTPASHARTIHPLTIPPRAAGGQRRGGQQVPG
jgi:hypothetical protein